MFLASLNCMLPARDEWGSLTWAIGSVARRWATSFILKHDDTFAYIKFLRAYTRKHTLPVFLSFSCAAEQSQKFIVSKVASKHLSSRHSFLFALQHPWLNPRVVCEWRWQIYFNNKSLSTYLNGTRLIKLRVFFLHSKSPWDTIPSKTLLFLLAHTSG